MCTTTNQVSTRDPNASLANSPYPFDWADEISEIPEIPEESIDSSQGWTKVEYGNKKTHKVIGPVCFVCQETGHVKRDCPTIGPCHKCHAFGHRAAWCPKRSDQGTPSSFDRQSQTAFENPARALDKNWRRREEGTPVSFHRKSQMASKKPTRDLKEPWRLRKEEFPPL
jgi:ribosomal protein L37AE/L43A